MQLADLRSRLAALGAGPLHERSLLKAWLHAKPLESGRHRAEDFLPLALRDALPDLAADLAVAATQKILTEKLDPAKAQSLIGDAIAELPRRLQ